MSKRSSLRNFLQPNLNPSSGEFTNRTLPVKSLERHNVYLFVIVSSFLVSLFPSPPCCNSSRLREFSSVNHRAGSPGDDSLANKVMKKFKEYAMNFWTDEHYVKVQDPPARGYNRFNFKNGSDEHPQGFLSYSPNGTVTVISKLKYTFFLFVVVVVEENAIFLVFCSRVLSCMRIMGRKVTSGCCGTKASTSLTGLCWSVWD